MYKELEREDRLALFCVHSPPVSDEWVAYTVYISALLKARPVYKALPAPDDYRPAAPNIFAWPSSNHKALHRNTGATQSGSASIALPNDTGLVVVADSRPTWPQRLLGQRTARYTFRQLPGSILLARNPRRPLRRILVVLRVHESDERALAWAVRLAASSGAAVTLLPIVPPHPRLYRRDTRILQGLDALFASDTFSEDVLLDYARQLDQHDIRGTIRRQQGAPEHQLRRELGMVDHDMIVIADEPFGRVSRLLLGEIVGPLLDVAGRPLLIAR